MTQEEQREKIIGIIQDSVGGCARHWAEIIANGLLANGVIVSTVKIGDKVYTYADKRVKEGKITFVGKNSRNEYKFIAVIGKCEDLLVFWDYDIGKTVFLTKEEAEAALKEREVK